MGSGGDGDGPPLNPRKTCPNNHVPHVAFGEEVDVVYCMECGFELRIVLPQRRTGVRRVELSVRDRGAGARPAPKRR